MPPVGSEPLAGVVRRRQRGVAVDRDVVVVVDQDEPAETEVTGQRRRLVADPLLETAVAGDDERVVVLDIGAEPRPELAFGDRQADGVPEALAERPGGDLDPRRVAPFGVAGRPRFPLPERPQVVHLQAAAREVQERVLEDGRVAVREHEPVAVGPGRVRGVVPHDAAEQDVTERRQRHGRALVAGLRRQRRVHGQPADDVDGLLVELGGEGRHRPSGYPSTVSGKPGATRPQRNSAIDAVKPWMTLRPATGPTSPAQNMPATAPPSRSWTAPASWSASPNI